MSENVSILIPTVGRPRNERTPVCFSQRLHLPEDLDLYKKIRRLEDQYGYPLSDLTDADPPAIFSGWPAGEQRFGEDVVAIDARFWDIDLRWEARHWSYQHGNAVMAYIDRLPSSTIIVPYWR